MQLEQDIPVSVQVRVYLLGPLEIWKRDSTGTWRLVEKETWKKSRPARSVFKRLLVQPGRRLSRSSIEDDLWSETDNFELATKNVYNAISLIRGVIGNSLVKCWEATYELAGQALIWTDIEACAALLKEAENRGQTLTQALPFLEQTLTLFERGEFLEGEDGRWCYAYRKRAEDMFRQARLWLSECYETQGKLWQAGELYRAIILTDPCDEEALQRWLEMLVRYGKRGEALKCYRDMKGFVEGQGLTLSPAIEKHVTTLVECPDNHLSASLGKSLGAHHSLHWPIWTDNNAFSTLPTLPDPPLDQFSALREPFEALQDTIASTFPKSEVSAPALIIPGHGLVGNGLLTVYRDGIMALYELYMSGHPHHVDALLPLYATQTAALCEAVSALLLPAAARLASLTQQLVCELATDREDFGVAQISGQRAYDYAHLARDPNLEVAALIKQGCLGFHRRDGRLARRAYDQAIALAHDERVTPLLCGRAYAGAAEVYAMRGEEQDALRAMGLAYDHFPARPEQDLAYPYLYASRYSLHVFGACQTQLFLGHPKDAQKALEALEREGNTDATKEPITRLDLLYYQGEIQAQQAEQEAVLATLTEAAQLAQRLGSMLYFRKLATIYQAVHARWPHDKAVRSIGEIFL